MIAGSADKSLVWGDVYEVDDRLVPVLDEIERVYPGVDSLFAGRRDRRAGGRQYACLYYPVAAHAIAGVRALRRATGFSTGASGKPCDRLRGSRGSGACRKEKRRGRFLMPSSYATGADAGPAPVEAGGDVRFPRTAAASGIR